MNNRFGKGFWFLCSIDMCFFSVMGVLGMLEITMPSLHGVVRVWPIVLLHMCMILYAIYGIIWFLARPGEFFKFMAGIGEWINVITPWVILISVEIILFLIAILLPTENDSIWYSYIGFTMILMSAIAYYGANYLASRKTKNTKVKRKR